MNSIISALIIGLCLGLLGSGGSILTVPILVYLIGRPEKIAILESLVIVGTIAATGSLLSIARKQIDLPSIIYFGLPGLIGAYAGASLSATLSGETQLMLFGSVMLFVAFMMIKGSKWIEQAISSSVNYKALVAQGLLVGALTGIIGAGGGFLIVPTLILFNKLPVEKAIGSSLLIITANTAMGFYKQMALLKLSANQIDWHLILLFSVVGSMSCIFGNLFSSAIPLSFFKKIFGFFILFIGIFILLSR